MNIITQSFKYGDKTIVLETGRIARQAQAAVFASMDDTQILATVVSNKLEQEPDFFPLAVHYVEKTYATGKIPGGYFKREGKPSDKEVLTSRLIDRPIRPLFPKNYRHEVQLVLMVVSANNSVNPDILALIAASAAMRISGLPFKTPIGAARIGFINQEYVLNPSYKEIENSSLDMILAGTNQSITMVESEANQVSEEVMLGALEFGSNAYQTVIENIEAFAQKANKPAAETQESPLDETTLKVVEEAFSTQMKAVLNTVEKQDRQKAMKLLKTEIKAKFDEVDGVSSYTDSIIKNIMRTDILKNKTRIDGRAPNAIRDISIDIDPLSNPHGSALFTRGETQALVTVTLGNIKEGQLIEPLHSKQRQEMLFLLHYNFPGYSVGEVSRLGFTSRREVGHGFLARKGLKACMPSLKSYPAAIRVVSEITESNGSSSMASVCGASLSLLAAGVPLKTPVAGIAMGLIKQGDDFCVLSDILGDEDHIGDMDFKVIGTASGINALQMDVKTQEMTLDILKIALSQAKEGIEHILGKMKEHISVPDTTKVKVNQATVHKINPKNIALIIGKKGANIQKITKAHYDTPVNIKDNGDIEILADSKEIADSIIHMMDTLIKHEVFIGDYYNAVVDKMTDFGAILKMGRSTAFFDTSDMKKDAERLHPGKRLRVRVLRIEDGKIKVEQE